MTVTLKTEDLKDDRKAVSAQVQKIVKMEVGMVKTWGWTCSQTLLMLEAAVLQLTTHTWSTCFRRLSMCRVTHRRRDKEILHKAPVLRPACIRTLLLTARSRGS